MVTPTLIVIISIWFWAYAIPDISLSNFKENTRWQSEGSNNKRKTWLLYSRGEVLRVTVLKLIHSGVNLLKESDLTCTSNLAVYQITAANLFFLLQQIFCSLLFPTESNIIFLNLFKRSYYREPQVICWHSLAQVKTCE